MVPLLVRQREGSVEAAHFGALVCCDRGGRSVLSHGDIDRVVLPRSTAKLFHALPMLTSGAASRFGLGAVHLALAAASHSAEPEHLEVLASWAARIGISVDDLACGPDWPLGARRGSRGGTPTPLQNNNSGKHLAVLTTCRHLGEATTDYCAPDHPAQLRLQAMTMRLCDVSAPTRTITDNCGMRTFEVPLASIALGAARLSNPDLLDAEIRPAVTSMLDAISAAPGYFGGQHRLVSEIVRLTGGRIIAKGGSEGLFLALDRAHGIGVALKIADGSSEAASVVLIESLVALKVLSEEEERALRQRAQHVFAHPFAPERGQALKFPWNDL